MQMVAKAATEAEMATVLVERPLPFALACSVSFDEDELEDEDGAEEDEELDEDVEEAEAEVEVAEIAKVFNVGVGKIISDTFAEPDTTKLAPLLEVELVVASLFITQFWFVPFLIVNTPEFAEFPELSMTTTWKLNPAGIWTLVLIRPSFIIGPPKACSIITSRFTVCISRL